MTREEIADEVAFANRGMHSAELADAVRALPVIVTCGECRWCSGSMPLRVTWCRRDEERRDVDSGDAPPSWCPMRGAVGR